MKIRVKWETGYIEIKYYDFIEMGQTRGQKHIFNKLMKLAEYCGGWEII